MLVVQDRTKTRIYSGLAKPCGASFAEDDARLAAVLENDAFVLETFILSVQSGQFYREHEDKFNADTAIDQYLLDNLSAARDALTDVSFEDALPAVKAHAFLGRCLFTCYLLEREVIGTKQLKAIEAPIEHKLHRLLRAVSPTEAAKLLFRLFRLLDDDFNGSMFGGSFSQEQSSIRARHVKVLIDLLSGYDFAKNQPALDFDFYDFRFIPIELISSIYEAFIASGEKGTTAPKNVGKSRTTRRKAGAYYTPPRLAELVVDIATDGWETLSDKRCLDPACGSGIFLVILFQRMAAEWSRLHPKANNVVRALALREILTTKLHGVDRDETACMVACFNLYLAFFDQLKPPDIRNLKTELDKRGAGKVLPPLQPNYDSGGACPVILACNFFNPQVETSGKFDLVIGNPPWVGRNQSNDDESKSPPDLEMRDWLFEAKQNPFLADAPKLKAERKARFFPTQQSAIAFMWKAPLHLKPGGHACLLLPTRVILSNSTDKFQAAWFSTFSVDAVWQLADYRHILFSGAKCPAIVVKCGPGKPDTVTAEISYFTPKVERLDPRRAAVVVAASEHKRLRLADLLKAASADCAYMFWKMPFWGTDRDQRLLARLRKMPKLGDIAGEPDEGKRWRKGGGFQPAVKSTTSPIQHCWGEDTLFLDANNKRLGLMLVEGDAHPVGRRFSSLHRLRDLSIYQAPMVLVATGFGVKLFSSRNVVFRHAFRSIAGDWEDEELLLFLTALLNTPLVTYYAFHTSANLGIERDQVHFEELLELPFPLPNDANSHRIVRDVAARMRRACDEMTLAGHNDEDRDVARKQAIGDVTKLVYRYFDLTPWEQTLVEETATIFEPSKTPKSYLKSIPTQRETSKEERATYAELLCQTINRWARRSGYSLAPGIRIARREGLALLTLQRTDQQLVSESIERDDLSADFRKILLRLARASVQESDGGLTFLRGFAHLEDDRVHILKPLALRYWTKTAALNDADELATHFAGIGAPEA